MVLKDKLPRWAQIIVGCILFSIGWMLLIYAVRDIITTEYKTVEAETYWESLWYATKMVGEIVICSAIMATSFSFFVKKPK